MLHLTDKKFLQVVVQQGQLSQLSQKHFLAYKDQAIKQKNGHFNNCKAEQTNG